MVNLVEEWETLEEYAGDKQGFYQILYGARGVEVRVAVGRLGFRNEFENPKDPLLNRIISFCSSQRYAKVTEKSEEIKTLLEVGFEYVCQKDSLIFLRKRK